MHTRPCPTFNTSKMISFEPAEQFRQLHLGCIHSAAPTLGCQAGTTLSPSTSAVPGPASCPRVTLCRGFFTAACFFQRPKPVLNLVPQPIPSHMTPKVPSTQKGTLSPRQAIAHLLHLAPHACKARAASVTPPRATAPSWHQALPLWPGMLITQGCGTTADVELLLL